jgi:trk system potassium uptake protein TrkA
MDIPQSWCGKSLSELRIRDKYHLNVIGIKEGDKVSVKIDPNAPLPQGIELIVIGDNESLEKFKN